MENQIIKSKYTKIETDSKTTITSLVGDVIESSDLHRIYTQKLANGNYSIEIMAPGEEPSIS